MTYLPDESTIVYRSKDNRIEKIFDALDWLAAMTTHISNQGEQMAPIMVFISTFPGEFVKRKRKSPFRIQSDHPIV